LTYEVISKAYAFFIFEQKSYFCPHIAEIFWQKTFGDIAPPVYYLYDLKQSGRPEKYFEAFFKYKSQKIVDIGTGSILAKNREIA
jgi:hypothetical protein